ncbi:monoglyceride lipase, putative [Ichthyophthirius multifiliis]|uniref:Sm protein E n=1 Tax=Ichthyophthirius multifiliis TaxID=5932 RepID=G0QK33_ICHMU|nr:monoglyceride lipase, putative [Ichthyophthirius multifiliis]EGR34424.1 monoglyceride lipase, putative [Ichthyophthirius multifiliis]|eukprot:XP_004039728.1 monoglyceride lipase, putative [Ichthyophthirius multifiliis]
MSKKFTKTITNPLTTIFGFLQKSVRVQIWLYENTDLKLEGKIVVIGFDEYMNMVIDEAIEVYKSKVQPPKAICLVFHGMNWHSGLQAHIAEHLSSQNIEVCAFDFKGHGKSQGLIGYIHDIQLHIKDAENFVNNIKEMYPEKPLFLCGFSLGGLTAFDLGLKNEKNFKGIIFLAPALKNHPFNFKRSIFFVKNLAKIYPKIKVTPDNRKSFSTHRNINVYNLLYKEGSLYNNQGLRAGTIKNIVEYMNYCQDYLKDFKVPFIVFQGGMDKLVDPQVGNILIQKCGSIDKEIIFKQEMWHGIPLEPEIQEYKFIISEWILKRI